MNYLLKFERVPTGILQTLFTMIMALCVTEAKNQVKDLPNYKDMKKKLDSVALLKAIKKIVYTGGSNNLNMQNNNAMVHINFMDLYQEQYQDIQEFRYMQGM